MATKYRLDPDENTDRRARIAERLELRARPQMLPAMMRPGGGGIFLMLGALICALILLQNAVDRIQQNTEKFPGEGVGIVTGKLPEDPGPPPAPAILQVRIDLEDATHEVWVPTDPASWDAVTVGDALAVEYLTSHDGSAFRITTLRALPSE